MRDVPASRQIQETAQDYSGFGLKLQTPTPKSAARKLAIGTFERSIEEQVGAGQCAGAIDLLVSSGDSASRRRPVPRKRPISADRSTVSHSRWASTLKMLLGLMRLSNAATSRFGDAALAQVRATEVDLAARDTQAQPLAASTVWASSKRLRSQLPNLSVR
jgi:hypothetical protein